MPNSCLRPAKSGPIRRNFYATLHSRSEDVAVQTYLQVSCGLGTTCDYSHTGAINLILTPNVTYTSDSGVFLTQTNTPGSAPEPASMALLFVGAGVLVVLRKRIHIWHLPVSRDGASG